MRDTIGWGILGTGGISRRFAADLVHAPGARVVAVASRERARAQALAAELGAPRAHVEVESLAADPAVDVVYVGTPHVRHTPDALACLRAGKAVLCEKPLTPGLVTTEQLLAEAHARGVFLMEALWTRFFPATLALLDQLEAGAVGEPTVLTADFGFRGDPASEPRLFDPAYAGGALLDVGVYPLWLATLLLGPAARVSAAAVRGPSGVDERTGVVLVHDGGGLSVLSAAISADTASAAVLEGHGGRVRLDSPWWRPRGFVVEPREGAPIHHRLEHLGEGYAHEAIEVMRCLRAGLTESPGMSWADSRALAALVEQVRAALAS